jgi:parallel beta-helix repeat protein
MTLKTKETLNLRGLSITILLLLISMTSSVAADITAVRVPQDFPTIQEAIENAQPGDVIEVDATQGPYQGPILIKKSLTLRSVNGRALIEASSPEETVIQIEGWEKPPVPKGIVEVKDAPLPTEVVEAKDFREPWAKGKYIHEGFETGTFKFWEEQEKEMRPLGEPWTIDPSISRKGRYSAKGGPTSKPDYDPFRSTLAIAIPVEAGTLTFFYRIDLNEEDISLGLGFCVRLLRLQYGNFYTIGSCYFKYQDKVGSSGWRQFSVNIPVAGLWVFEWFKFNSGPQEVSPEAWDVWIDDIYFPPLADVHIPDFPKDLPSLNVTVQGFQISGGKIGIQAGFIKNITLEDNLIEGADDGIVLENVHESIIRKNHVRDAMEEAILVKNSSKNQFLENIVEDSNIGLKLDIGAIGNIIQGNTFRGQRRKPRETYSYSDGFALIVSSPLPWIQQESQLIDNLIEDNEQGVLINTWKVIVQDNTIRRNSGVGIEVSVFFHDKGKPIGVHLRDNIIESNGIGISIMGCKDIVSKTGLPLVTITAGIEEECTPVMLTGNLIQANRREGIRLDTATLGLLEGNEICDNGGAGILVIEGGRHTLKGNTIEGNRGQGIALVDSNQNSTRENQIQDHPIGILVQAKERKAEENFLEGNQIIDNLTAIQLEKDAQTAILGNTLEGGREGIRLDRSRAAQIKNNRIFDHRENGIMLQGTERSALEGNEITGGEIGVLLESSQGNTLMKNVFQGNGVGIQLKESNKNTLQANQVSSDSAGIVLNRSSGNMLENNIIEAKADWGIALLDESTSNLLRQNEIQGGIRGLWLQAASINRLEQNQVRRATTALALQASYKNLILRNIFEANDTGSRLEASNDNYLEGNTYSENVIGLVLVHASRNRVQNSLFKLNHDQGISLDQADANIIAHNVIEESPLGILLKSASQNTLSANRILQATLTAISLSQSSNDNLLETNYCAQGGSCIIIKESAENRIKGNQLKDSNSGLVLTAAQHNRLWHNWIQGNVVGIKLEATIDNEIRENEITANGIGIEVKSGCEQNIIEQNNIRGNGDWGLLNAGVMPVEATMNWWGDPSGPGGVGPGVGDHVSEGVVFEPWLKAPVGIPRP